MDGALDDRVAVEELLRLDDLLDRLDRPLVLRADRLVQARVVDEVEVAGRDLEARLRQRHLEVLDERAEEGPASVEAAQLTQVGPGERCAAPVPGRKDAAVLCPREDPGNGAERLQELTALRPPRRPRADLEERELLDRRELAEERLEAPVLPHERAIGGERVRRQRAHRLARVVGRT